MSRTTSRPLARRAAGLAGWLTGGLLLAGCAGPGFQAEVLYGERTLGELELHTSVPDSPLLQRDTRVQRSALRLAMGGPDYSGRGYMQVFGERIDTEDAAGDSGTFDVAGLGIGVVGRHVLGKRTSRVRAILPYRAGLDFLKGDGSGMAAPGLAFGDLEALVWDLELGVGATWRGLDLVVGYALTRFDGKLDVSGPGGTQRDGLRGSNSGPWVSGAYQLRDLPLRVELRAGFGDLKETRVTAGLFY